MIQVHYWVSSRDSGFFILCVNMAKIRTIQVGIEAPGRREDIPPRHDEFLRMLARWTVEDMQHTKPFQADTNINRVFEEMIYE